MENLQNIQWDTGANDLTADALNVFDSNLTETDLREDLICNDFVIKGYIAGRKNTLSPCIDVEAAKKMFDQALNEEKAAGNTPMVDGNIIENFSQKALKSLKGEDILDQLMGNGHYRVNVKETKPEFYVLGYTRQEERSIEESDDDMYLLRLAQAVSEDNNTIIIRPKKLFDQVIEQREGIMKITSEGSLSQVAGSVCPIYTPGVGKSTGQFVLKTQYVNVQREKVTDIGYLDGVLYGVNKRYEGNLPAYDTIVIENKAYVDRYKPGLAETLENNPRTMHETIKAKDIPVDASGNKENQEIEYNEYANEYRALGITEDMLSEMRTGKTGRTSIISRKELQSMFKESRREYLRYKQSLKVNN